MMAFDTFKDLKKGDRVKFENVSDPVYGNVSGEGAVIWICKVWIYRCCMDRR